MIVSHAATSLRDDIAAPAGTYLVCLLGLRRPRGASTRVRLGVGMKKVAARLLCAAAAPALFSRRLRRRRLTILMFQGVEAEPLSATRDPAIHGTCWVVPVDRLNH
jgi:hypothetical protein